MPRTRDGCFGAIDPRGALRRMARSGRLHQRTRQGRSGRLTHIVHVPYAAPAKYAGILKGIRACAKARVPGSHRGTIGHRYRPTHNRSSEDGKMSRKTKRSVPIAVALCVLGNGISAQENVVSPGGVLVERQLLDKSLTARETLEVFERPEREWLLPIFWTQPELAGTITEGEIVRVVGVKETYLWRDRFVWLELERRRNSDDAERVWFRIGPQETASAQVWTHWTRTPTNLQSDDQPPPLTATRGRPHDDRQSEARRRRHRQARDGLGIVGEWRLYGLSSCSDWGSSLQSSHRVSSTRWHSSPSCQAY